MVNNANWQFHHGVLYGNYFGQVYYSNTTAEITVEDQGETYKTIVSHQRDTWNMVNTGAFIEEGVDDIIDWVGGWF